MYPPLEGPPPVLETVLEDGLQRMPLLLSHLTRVEKNFFMEIPVVHGYSLQDIVAYDWHPSSECIQAEVHNDPGHPMSTEPVPSDPHPLTMYVKLRGTKDLILKDII